MKYDNRLTWKKVNLPLARELLKADQLALMNNKNKKNKSSSKAQTETIKEQAQQEEKEDIRNLYDFYYGKEVARVEVNRHAKDPMKVGLSLVSPTNQWKVAYLQRREVDDAAPCYMYTLGGADAASDAEYSHGYITQKLIDGMTITTVNKTKLSSGSLKVNQGWNVPLLVCNSTVSACASFLSCRDTKWTYNFCDAKKTDRVLLTRDQKKKTLEFSPIIPVEEAILIALCMDLLSLWSAEDVYV
ncbi:predicted protein [Chaetoceros tenuissimus]|uniref:Uncharacterized protein n=1 Tax=Chaetoceros tenuissimus TaxID=426638 RepID=A0AAD3CSR8_9STRA|nr:predicted protein [Chaetoceros tenuissimus]